MSIQITLVQNPEASDNAVPMSKLLQRFLEEHLGDEVCLRDLFNEMENRAFASTMLICALPEALPLPIVGIFALVAMPLLLVSAQLVLGFDKPCGQSTYLYGMFNHLFLTLLLLQNQLRHL